MKFKTRTNQMKYNKLRSKIDVGIKVVEYFLFAIVMVITTPFRILSIYGKYKDTKTLTDSNYFRLQSQLDVHLRKIKESERKIRKIESNVHDIKLKDSKLTFNPLSESQEKELEDIRVEHEIADAFEKHMSFDYDKHYNNGHNKEYDYHKETKAVEVLTVANNVEDKDDEELIW